MNKVYLISVPLECFISQDFLSTFIERGGTRMLIIMIFFFGVGVAIAIFYMYA